MSQAIAISLIITGAALRVALCWANPTGNTYDDFFEPIFLLLREGAIPAKDACYECFHPPVLFVMSAAVAKPLIAIGGGPNVVMAALTWMNCAIGIATLLLVQKMLARLPLSAFARVFALAIVCFLPRHIYMSVMFTNDALVTFFSVACVWFMLRALDNYRWADFAGVAVAASLAIFTKYTAFPLLPMLALSFVLARRPLWRSGLIAVSIPAVLLVSAMALNYQDYGTPLPNNSELSKLSPGGEAIRADFVDFTPWRFVSRPLVGAGQLSSVWTLTYANMWFDTDGRFLYLLGDQRWWDDFYSAIVKGSAIPADTPPTATGQLMLGSGLELVGVGALALAVIGLWTVVRWRTSLRIAAPLLVLLLLNLALIGLHAKHMPEWHMPCWSAMKASYLLPSLPAMVLLFGYGCDQLGRVGRLVIVGGVSVLGLLVIAHVFGIVAA